MERVELVKRQLEVIKTVMNAVKEAGIITCGTLYAMLMELGCTINQYEQIEQMMLNTGLVKKRNNQLIWV